MSIWYQVPSKLTPSLPRPSRSYVVQVLTTVPSNCYSALVVPEAPGARADSGDDTAALDTVLRLLDAKIRQVTGRSPGGGGVY